MKSRLMMRLALLAIAVGGGIYCYDSGTLARRHSNTAGAACEALAVHESPGAPRAPASIELVTGVLSLAGVRTTPASLPTRKRELTVSGQLGLDPDRFVHVHARFPGQIAELASVEETTALSAGAGKTSRVLSFMDRVEKGQRLGVLCSNKLGEKKSELVVALARLRTDQSDLDRLALLFAQGATSEKALREAECQADLSRTDVERVRRTLRGWSLTDQEIAEVETEAERLHEDRFRGAQRAARTSAPMPWEENWARVDIVAPIDGTIVEKNVVAGNIVDAADELFKIADLSTLIAWVHVHEEDLLKLQSLELPIPWQISINSLSASAPIAGEINWIGRTIDPHTHMALIGGPASNKEGRLFVGQFITATIALPPEQDVVEIPARALIEDGKECAVLVQSESQRDRFYRRRVSVVRRFTDVVYVRSRLTTVERSRGAEELHEGELVMSAGALELKAALAKPTPLKQPGRSAVRR